VNTAASRIIANDFMRGFFETLDALLATGITSSVGDMEEAGEESLRDRLAAQSVVMRGNVNEAGVVAVLLPPKDALYLESNVMGGSPPEDDVEAIPDAKHGSVKEVFDSCLGGGCGGLKETFGQELTFTDVDVTQGGPDSAGELLEALGGSAAMGDVEFSSPDGFKGTGTVLVAETLNNLLPDELLADAGSGGGGAEISSDEMGDILGGFEPESEGQAAPAAVDAPPGNIEMVLDIRLVCTARLGRVEMPIGEILELGPGSIVEVGHLIDEPVELLVNDKLIARGDVVVVDEKFGLRITEIVSPAERIKSLR